MGNLHKRKAKFLKTRRRPLQANKHKGAILKNKDLPAEIVPESPYECSNVSIPESLAIPFIPIPVEDGVFVCESTTGSMKACTHDDYPDNYHIAPTIGDDESYIALPDSSFTPVIDKNENVLKSQK